MGPDTLENIPEKWTPEIRHFCPTAPIVLVGNKKDLRDNPNTIQNLKQYQQEPVKIEDGKLMAKQINAVAYLECSAKKQRWCQRSIRNCNKGCIAKKETFQIQKK